MRRNRLLVTFISVLSTTVLLVGCHRGLYRIGGSYYGHGGGQQGGHHGGGHHGGGRHGGGHHGGGHHGGGHGRR